MLAHRLQIMLLEFVLEVDPLVPGLIERQAVYLLKLIGVITPTACIASPPVEQPLRAVSQREVIHESRAVEVIIGPSLKVDLVALGGKPERVVELGTVVHHGAEDHFVIAALRAP